MRYSMVSLLCSLCFCMNGAAPGALDTLFAGRGYVVNTAYRVTSNTPVIGVVQSNGQTVVALTSTDFKTVTLLRYTLDGELDSSFGNGRGSVIVHFDDVCKLYAARVVNDAIILVGYKTLNSQNGFIVLKFTENGVLDTTFGQSGTGMVTTYMSGYHLYGYGLTIASNGSIIVVGNSSTGKLIVARYTAGGILDGTFNPRGTYSGVPGVALISKSGYFLYGDSVLVQYNGRLVIYGDGNDGTLQYAVLARLRDNGTLDVDFGSSGLTLTPLTSAVTYYEGLAIEAQSTGALIAIAYAETSTDMLAVVFRYSRDGVLDTTFGDNGMATSTVNFAARDGLVQSDDRIVVGGYTFPRDWSVPTLLRFTAGGMVDTSFGTQGMAVANAMVANDQRPACGNSLYPEPDGKILMAGAQCFNRSSCIWRPFMARYLSWATTVPQAQINSAQQLVSCTGMSESAVDRATDFYALIRQKYYDCKRKSAAGIRC